MSHHIGTPVKIAKVDWFADLHHQCRSGLRVVGGLAERTENHACGADMFIRVDALNNCCMTLAPRRPSVDPVSISGRTAHVKRVELKYVVLHFK